MGDKNGDTPVKSDIGNDDVTSDYGTSRQRELLCKVQLKARATYFEALLDRILETIASEKPHRESQESTDDAVAAEANLDVFHENDISPLLAPHEIAQALYVAGECQRMRLICALHHIQCHVQGVSGNDYVNTDDTKLQEELRNEILEIPLATGGVIGVYGEQYSTTEAIREHYSYLSRLSVSVAKELPTMSEPKEECLPQDLPPDAVP